MHLSTKIKNKAHSLTLAQARKSQSILRLFCAKAQTAQTEQQILQTAKRAKMQTTQRNSSCKRDACARNICNDQS